MSIEELIRILEEALSRPELITSLVDQLQREVFNTRGGIEDSEEWSILRDLAYDLDFYEANSKVRREDQSFYGDERAKEEIMAALKDLVT